MEDRALATIPERLRAACRGHPAAHIPWPHRLLHEAADRIEALEAAGRTVTIADAPGRWTIRPAGAHYVTVEGLRVDRGQTLIIERRVDADGDEVRRRSRKSTPRHPGWPRASDDDPTPYGWSMPMNVSSSGPALEEFGA